jgi:peptidoglycan/LPS O-acetylase OafA/YrhL
MMQVLYVGIILGTMLFISKFVLIFFLPKWIQRTIGYNNFTLFLTDVALGMLAAKTLSMADGTIALGASITFGFLSIIYICTKVGAKKVKTIGGEFLCASRPY